MQSLNEVLGEQLAERRRQHLYRQRKLLASPQAANLILDGKAVLAFSSNDYLGLANHPEVIAAFTAAAQKYGVGGGASHLICGHSIEHHQLEEELADFCGRSKALLFSTGYMANLGVISALVGSGDLVLEDKLNHASLLDGGLLSGARFQRYLHNDMASLDKHLHKDARRKMVITDGVFSMDGDLAKLPEIAAICSQKDAWLMVDDAHGFGVLGASGGGIAEHFGLTETELPVLMGTLGKGFGTAGAFIAGSAELVDYLVQFSRPYIYTTAMPPAVAAATRASLKLVKTENWRRQKLQKLVAQFRQGAANLGLELMPSPTPIQPVMVGSESRCMAIGEYLWQQGIHVGTIRPPTVPKNTARLRVTLNANHSEDDVARLLSALESAFAAIAEDNLL
ncbi:MAG: 8-amino-7-oxononanoate synthase [Porticoccaceae bacterium]|nr:8-amino-7-oxononanoate synthase [Porticoccaceae bacterium]